MQCHARETREAENRSAAERTKGAIIGHASRVVADSYDGGKTSAMVNPVRGRVSAVASQLVLW